jgi:uncharacterized membrane protein YhaH (DUF805 family)
MTRMTTTAETAGGPTRWRYTRATLIGGPVAAFAVSLTVAPLMPVAMVFAAVAMVVALRQRDRVAVAVLALLIMLPIAGAVAAMKSGTRAGPIKCGQQGTCHQ